MENMDKGLAVPKWVLIVWPKIPQMPPKISPQKFRIFERKLSLGVRSPYTYLKFYGALLKILMERS